VVTGQLLGTLVVPFVFFVLYVASPTSRLAALPPGTTETTGTNATGDKRHSICHADLAALPPFILISSFFIAAIGGWREAP